MRATNSPLEAIRPDPGREGAVRLVAGGRTLLTVPTESAIAEGLKVGMIIGPDQLGRLAAAADEAAAYRTALALLGRRGYARHDLGRRLRLKGHLPVHVDAALERAEAAGFLDDARFAVQFSETRSAQGKGPVRIRQELAAMGVAREHIDRALASETMDSETVARRVELLIIKRRKQLGGLAVPEARRRIVAYLARRGFRGPEVLRLVRDRLS